MTSISFEDYQKLQTQYVELKTTNYELQEGHRTGMDKFTLFNFCRTWKIQGGNSEIKGYVDESIFIALDSIEKSKKSKEFDVLRQERDNLVVTMRQMQQEQKEQVKN